MPLALVQITIDGVKVLIPAGQNDLASFIKHGLLNTKTNQLSLVSHPSPASTVNGNDSFNVQGGEVFTSVHS